MSSRLKDVVMSRLACVALGLVATLSWAAENAEKVNFEDHIKPILRQHCAGCHNPDKKSADLDVTSYPALIAGSSSGEVAIAEDPNSSMLYLTANHDAEPKMPPNGPKIEQVKLDAIKKWIEGGLLETATGTAKKSTKPKMDLSLKAPAIGKPEGPPPMPPANLRLEPVVTSPRADLVRAMASSPWAPLLAVSGQQQVVLYNTDTLEYLGVLPFPEGIPNVLKFSRSGGLLLAAGGVGALSGKVVVWDIRTGERVIEVGDEVDEILAADISSDQSRIAIGNASKLIKLYDTSTGQLIQSMKKHTDWILTLEFSPDSVLLATGDRSGGMHVWEAFSGNLFYTVEGDTGPITDITWRSDSNVVAGCSDATGKVKMYEMTNGTKIKDWGAHGGGCFAVEYTHSGDLVTAGRDKVAKTWDGNGGGKRTFPAMKELATAATFSHDGKLVIASDWFGEITVWKAEDGAVVGALVPNPPALATRIQDAQAKVNEAQAKVNAANQVLATAEKTLADQKQKIADTLKQVEARKQGIAAADVMKKQAAEKKVASEQMIQKAPAEITAKEQAVKAATETVAARKAELTPILNTLASEDRDQKHAAKNQEIAAAEKALVDANAALEAAKRLDADGKAGVAAAAKMDADADATKKRLTDEIPVLEKQAKDLEATLPELTKKVEEAKGPVAEAMKPLQAAQQTLKHWQDGLARK